MEHEKFSSDQEVLAEAILDTDDKVYVLSNTIILVIPLREERF